MHDCILFIWVIDPMLPEAIKVIESWGFKYKTVAFTWVKKNKKSRLTILQGNGLLYKIKPRICVY